MIKITDDMMSKVMTLKMERAKSIYSKLSAKYNTETMTGKIDCLANVPNLSEIFLAVCVMDMNEYENPEYVLRLAIETNKTLEHIKKNNLAMKWLEEL